MASNSDRRSDSSDRSTSRRRVVIGPQDTSRVRYDGAARGEAPKRDSERARRGGSRSKPVPGDLTSPGRRVAGNRAEERDRRLHRQRRKTRLRVALIVLAVVAVVASVVLIYRSSVFSIGRVDVVGARRLTKDQVRAIAQVPADATLLRLPVRDIEARLRRSPWVATAEVSRDFPDGLRIRITEREPAALVDAGGSAIWQVDATGVWLAPDSGETTSSLVLIRDVPGLDPAPGRRTRSETLMNAVEVARQLDTYLRPLVRTVVAPAIDKTALITADDVEIFVGSSDDIARKQEIARKILQQQAGKVVYINVRSVDRPTWRGLPENR
jgi:cell division protein FtsQ